MASSAERGRGREDSGASGLLVWFNGGGSLSTFDLLANPFAVVGVSIDASRARIGETIDDALFEDDSPTRQRELDNARQALFAPRARLEAEIGFLPGSDDETVAEVLTSLRKGKSAQSADSLTGIDRVNYLAHRCAVGDAAAKARTAKSPIRKLLSNTSIL